MTLEEIRNKYNFMKDVCFEHGEGWANIVDEFCAQLKYLFDKEGTDYGFCILQEKEKYGQLTIYYSFEDAPEELTNIIDILYDSAVEKSTRTCEKCGASGTSRGNNSWIHVYCDDCEDKYIESLR